MNMHPLPSRFGDERDTERAPERKLRNKTFVRLRLPCLLSTRDSNRKDEPYPLPLRA